MSQPLPYDYYYGNEADQYTFYRLPKALFTNERYRTLSDSAKLLYGLVLDRMGLSNKNGWFDEKNRVYIIFTLESIQELMNCKHEKAVKLLAELDIKKGVGLIERVRRGQGKPSIIYVRKFFDSSEFQTSENQKSRTPNNRSQDFRKSESNNNNLNNKEYQSIYQSLGDTIDCSDDEISYDPTEENKEIDTIDEIGDSLKSVKENIEYEILSKRHHKDRIDEMVALIASVLNSRKEKIRIAGDNLPADEVKKQFRGINQFHIEYVLDCIDQNRTEVRNIKQYLLTTLYNAPMTMDHYYTALVNSHYYGQKNKY